MPPLHSRLLYHARTALLFTLSDLKTILFPISVFACATAPPRSAARILLAGAWIWAHQLLCNLSNQARARAEDAANKPWRPLPAGRVTPAQVAHLRWAVLVACLLFSAARGRELAGVTLGLMLLLFMYDDRGMSGHWVAKNVFNAGGYALFEVGATTLVGASRRLDATAATAVAASALVILSTIHTQDFADVAGDAELGRRTLPLRFPALARWITLAALPAWSALLARFWALGPACAAVFVCLGAATAAGFFCWRGERADRRSFGMYTVWLTAVHVLPLHARTGCFSF